MQIRENQEERDSIPYETFFHQSRDALIITNEHLEVVKINKQALKILQTSREACIGNSIRCFINLVPDEVLQYQMAILKNKGHYNDEWLVNDELGIKTHIEFEAHHEGDYYFFVLRDITSYKKNENDLLIATNLFQDVFTKVTDGILLFDIQGQLIDVNGAFLSIVGLHKEQLIGKVFHEMLSSQSQRKWLEDWEIVLEQGNVENTVELQINEQTFFFDFSMYQNIYNQQLISVFKDVTEKKLIELQLKESKEIFSYIFEQAIDAIVLVDGEGFILEANEVACDIFELPKETLVGSEINDFIMKKDKKFHEVSSRFLQTGEIREELFYLMPNGQRKLLEFTAKKMDGTNKSITIFRNVSERYEMEVKLRKSEKQFRKIFDGMSDGLILWKANQIFDVNEVGSKILKLSKKRIKSMSVDELLSYISQIDNGLDRMRQKLEKQNNVEEVLSFTDFDGKTMHLEISTKKNLVSGLHLTVFKVVTEKLELQEQLRKSDTLSVVGELAAGIAHEIRNPMTALKGFIQLLQSSVQEDFSNYFDIITSELKRIDLIITEFLILAKPQAVQYEEQDINIIVEETITLLSAESILYNIVFVKQLYENPLLLYCESNQLKQVFINIIKNAIESMGSGGYITISTTLHNEKMVKISISDEGCGIPEEKVKKLGEPFYTTKDRGTGLGLMVSYKIIEEHKGWIEVESIVNKGTVFSIFLPYHIDFEEWI
ncbi:PAS domain-containing sensor histidine kinase [Bacillus massiliigorillae]|uniref:PAS domain-containing sensor histidine kinase n=1 Tax=Bacillus massiliigorillae TaxID=1243664 RepID=UPI00039AFCD3|nr:PAS domain-containing sensor histidine kinase [Bacillus massiliigorillae]